MAAARHAPAFEIGSVAGRAWQLAAALWCGAMLLLVLAQICIHACSRLERPSWPLLVAGALVLLGVAVWAGWRWGAPRRQWLSWDGQGWWWRAGLGCEQLKVRPIVLIDLGGWLWLRLYPDTAEGAAGWPGRLRLVPPGLLLSRGDAPALWPLLRATLFAARS